MAFKFNPDAASERKYVTKAGTYVCTIASAKTDWLPPRADLYTRLAFVTTEGETVFGDIFGKPDKDGGHYRLESFVAASATEAERAELLAGGEVEVDDVFLTKVTSRAIGRVIKVKVTERKYVKKDGSEGVAYQASSFVRTAEGPGPF